MTAFSLEPAQLTWCDELRALAAERLRPLAEKGEPGRVNRALIAELGALGLLPRLFTSGALDLCLMRESLAHACTEAETALALQGLGAHPVHAHGTEAQRARWLPRVSEGTAVAAFALSEPDAGSDAAALSLRAEPDAGRTDLRDDGRNGAQRSGARDTARPADGRAATDDGLRPAAARPGDRGRERASAGEAGARDAGWSNARQAHGPDGAAPDAGAAAARHGGPSAGAAGARDAGRGAGGGASAPEAGRADAGRAAAAPAALAADADGPSAWRLTGEKCWISNAPEADFYTVFARTTPGAGARGVTAFLVPADRPGLSGTPLDMLSPHPIGALALDAVPVTADDVLGEPDRGFRVAMDTLNLFRPSVGAFAVGMAQAALDATLAHTTARDAFGGKLRDLQAVSHQVAEMALRTEAARLMVYAAATAYDAGAPDVPRRAAMAKLLATETAQYVVDKAVQLHGARALRRGHLLEHLYREVRAPRIYEGASEVQRGIIAKELYRTPDATTKEAGA
ncbi:acyl-CoA dehydrogenase family protein [Streptomyces sp. RM72]|uniref:acyl-CoA dehydrogenase family protein n=1 Tax=Streptomyces sp. RM72 TaxID=1115510 RepID=UPI001FFC6ECC|nr:acyl-CoA dehydrogenase family protein [Streptomyces sp. RM72]